MFLSRYFSISVSSPADLGFIVRGEVKLVDVQLELLLLSELQLVVCYLHWKKLHHAVVHHLVWSCPHNGVSLVHWVWPPYYSIWFGFFGLSNLFVFLVGRRITHSRSYSQWLLFVLLEVFLEPYSINLHVILPIGTKITYTRKETGSKLLKCSLCPEADHNFPIEYSRPPGMYGNYVNVSSRIGSWLTLLLNRACL
ncbi:hypothetical protein RHMOL_Rhmol05G0276200 [Rhododendron molle]|uniref:Uncharacterized protein n=1 Tax=Rhododendron molle TaxID=49168 RepID=A0ACC0NTX1_RHOML|nr:hypothetical protein RHMOL_Rhmol05G0276200 [Rhododendron molle]